MKCQFRTPPPWPSLKMQRKEEILAGTESDSADSRGCCQLHLTLSGSHTHAADAAGSVPPALAFTATSDAVDFNTYHTSPSKSGYATSEKIELKLLSFNQHIHID